jgi:deoxyribodipyrimidine photo-lyase
MAAINIFWHRRDLRLEDNAGLYHALKSENPVLSLFIFDENILSKLEEQDDARVSFIHQEIHRLSEELQAKGSALVVKYGKPLEIWKSLIEDYEIAEVFTNRDYEPYAKERDEAVEALLKEHDIPFHTFKDHVIFEKKEITTKSESKPYTVFTPYSRTWKAKLKEKMEQGLSYYFKSYPNEKYQSNYFKTDQGAIPTLEEMGFEPTSIEFPSREVKQGMIKKYDKQRNFPAINGTSRLGIHFRFGTISIREKARKAEQLNETFLNELIWRDFYAQILANFPKVATQAFRAEYDQIEWRNNEADFKAWCEGKTGYPMVDAGMRELNATGYMHNRVRMVVASFLTKHLLIDWRWGEAYFAMKLLDFDLASNNGGWQWASGSGTDAAPYFRIFNPESQLKKFDKDLEYVKKWVSEYGTDDYPDPIVEHKFARERCLATYKATLKKD